MQYCCYLGEAQRKSWAKARREEFYGLTKAIWRGDLKEVIKILARNPSLVDFSGFTFHLPMPTTSVLDYAKAFGRPAIIHVLEGFKER